MPPLRRVAPPLALMGLIFFLSAQPNLDSGLGWADFVLRKCAHMTEYGALWWLWSRALWFRHPALAAGIAIAYAATDELHQSFVPTRDGTPRDVLIDAAGVAIAVLLRRATMRRRRRSAGPLAGTAQP